MYCTMLFCTMMYCTMLFCSLVCRTTLWLISLYLYYALSQLSWLFLSLLLLFILFPSQPLSLPLKQPLSLHLSPLFWDRVVISSSPIRDTYYYVFLSKNLWKRRSFFFIYLCFSTYSFLFIFVQLTASILDGTRKPVGKVNIEKHLHMNM